MMIRNKKVGRREIVFNSARWAVTGLACSTIGCLAAGPASAKTEAPDYGTTRDQWLDGLFAEKKVGQPLIVGRFIDRIYFLNRPISWSPNPGQKHKRVEVPKGFVTDFASIPRPFWSLFPTDGEYVYAAVIHDYLYWTQTRPRSEADQIFKFAMQDLKVGRASTAVIYGAVWAAGGFAWSANARLKISGEKRILKAE